MKTNTILWRTLFSILAGVAFIAIYAGTPIALVGAGWLLSAVLLLAYWMKRRNWMLWGYVGIFFAFVLFSFVAGWMAGGAGYALPLLLCLFCTYLLLAHEPLLHLLCKRTYPAVAQGNLRTSLTHSWRKMVGKK